MKRSLIPWHRKETVAPSARDDRNPFELLHREMNDLFGSFMREFDDPFRPGLAEPGRGWMAPVSPTVDVSETEDEVQVAAELPGLEEKDIEVGLDGDVLTISGEKKAEREEKKRNYHLVERSYGRFQRAIPLPPGVDTNKAAARFKNGVLTVTVPRTPEAGKQRKTIAIAAG